MEQENVIRKLQGFFFCVDKREEYSNFVQGGGKIFKFHDTDGKVFKNGCTQESGNRGCFSKNVTGIFQRNGRSAGEKR